MLKKKSILAAKVEGTVGTAETLLAAQAGFNVFNAEIAPTIEMEQRQGQKAFSQLAGVPGARMGTATFQIQLVGDGSGGSSVPLWASTFLPGCGLIQSGVGPIVYTVSTTSPTGGSDATAVRTLTIGKYEDGVFKRIRGAVGNCRITMPSGKIIMLDFTFIGIWDPVTDASLLTSTDPSITPLRFASSALTIGGATPACMEQIELDFGNEIFMRTCPTDESGYKSGLITGRRVNGTMNPESVLVATNDVFGKWLAGTEEALSIPVGDGTDEITIAAPKLQRFNIQPGERNGQQIDEVEFQCNKSGSAGDDELTITFGAP